ncbi:hypothetical protein D9756_010558 [Leucocoprinus leucothites]|uniref:ABC transporter domain-containing protein n=1 Tax=Leucocoprinus leucothites TaxID=201217 RepID=A0A8H5FRW5_9AGAR|nr:hypothetical protein D9756_010558 [Leucoagaricus leucothites]
MLVVRYKPASITFLRAYSTKPIIHIPKSSSIHPFGDPSNRLPVLRDVEWQVNEGEAWAVMSASSGEGGKRALFRTLLGHLRILTDSSTASKDGLFPFLGRDADPFSTIASVSFSHRSDRGSGGAFYDYTARYGAIRDEDALTLRESMFPESIPEDKPDPLATSPFEKPKVKKRAFEEVVQLEEEERKLFDTLVKEMDLERLLDLPLVALSNGQTRRARIVRAVLRKPELMLLDEPLTGLDVAGRPKLLHLLSNLHKSRKPRVILGLRTQDDIPAWITHVALVQEGTVKAGMKESVVPLINKNLDSQYIASSAPGLSENVTGPGPVVLDLQNVNVKYSDRVVLNDINWQIRQGERWHLQGANGGHSHSNHTRLHSSADAPPTISGSGKTTLMSLILGDHPQSYIQKHLLLPSPSTTTTTTTTTFTLNHRKRIPTPSLRKTIGVVSPELFDAFPRRHPGMTVREAIGTGFEGVFVPLSGPSAVGADAVGEEELRTWREERVKEVLDHLGPASWIPQTSQHRPLSKAERNQITNDFAQKRFTDISTGEQRIVLLMRALVGKPPVVLLDEVWSGMSEEMVSAARMYLRERVWRGRDQAVVVITHWEEEVPWSVEEGLRRFRLEGGYGAEVVV